MGRRFSANTGHGQFQAESIKIPRKGHRKYYFTDICRDSIVCIGKVFNANTVEVRNQFSLFRSEMFGIPKIYIFAKPVKI